MTAVNEHLNRQIVPNNGQQQILSNDNELFCLTNAIVSTDCRTTNSTMNSNQFHPNSNQQVLQSHNSGNLSNNTSNLTNLTNASPINLQTNCLNGQIENGSTTKKCDLNNNTINDNDQLSDLMNGEPNRTLTRLNGATVDSQLCDNGCMNLNEVHHMHETHQLHQSDDYSDHNLINNKNSSIVNSIEDNCHQSYAHNNFNHPLNQLNHLNHLNHLDRSSLNVNSTCSVNKLNVSGRRGRPPKKDKSRSRQSRGK